MYKQASIGWLCHQLSGISIACNAGLKLGTLQVMIMNNIHLHHRIKNNLINQLQGKMLVKVTIPFPYTHTMSLAYHDHKKGWQWVLFPGWQPWRGWIFHADKKGEKSRVYQHIVKWQRNLQTYNNVTWYVLASPMSQKHELPKLEYIISLFY